MLYGSINHESTFRRNNEMNKMELIEAVAKQADLSKKDAEGAV
jgi:hypothetical protein